MNFVRAIGQSQNPSVTEQRRQREIVVADAGTAVNLNRVIHNLLKHLRHHCLDHGDFLQGAHDALGIQGPGAFQGQKPSLFDVHSGIGDDVRVAAQLGDRAAEGFAGHGAFDHDLQSAFSSADGAHAVVYAARAKAALGDFEAAAGAGDDGAFGQAYVVEQYLAVAIGLVVGTEDRQHALNGDARGVERHQHHGVTAMFLGVRVGYTHENTNFAVRVADASAPPFSAVEYDFVAFNGGGGFHVGGVGGGHGRFGHAEGGADFAAQQFRQPLGFLFFRAVVDQHFHVAGVRRVAVEDFRGDEAAAGFFGNQGVVRVEQAAAVFVVREEHVPQALGLGLFFQLLDDWQHHPAVVQGGKLLVVLLFDGIDLVTHELFHAVEVILAFLGNVEIHGAAPRACLPRWGRTFSQMANSLGADALLRD